MIINNAIEENVPKRISENSKEELFEFLKIEDSPSFEFIYIKWIETWEHFDCLELKFRISRQDYDQNGLTYGESWKEVLLDCNYIEKEENGIYTCIVRRTNTTPSEESYEKLLKIKRENN